MSQYNEKTKIWLNNRFKMHDDQGIYYAHQPIYGFRKGHSEPFLISRYIRTYQIMRALSHLKFNSLLDVGAAEGYQAYIVRSLFGVKVECCDLSEEACRRAEEIFRIKATHADIHDLPYKNSEFDVILCSETLEHVEEFDEALEELLRVASKAVIITVPHEPKAIIDKNIKEKIDHAHIRCFNLNSFDFVRAKYGYEVLSRKLVIPLIRYPGILVEAMPISDHEAIKSRKLFMELYNSAVPLLRRSFGKRIAAFLIQLDDFFSKLLSSYNSSLSLILKDNKCYLKEAILDLSANQIINFAVPFHYLKQNV